MYWTGHITVGYLAYVVFSRVTDRPTPDRSVLTAIIAGSIFPDLIDKPLAWHFGILASGRSLMHSLLTLSVVAVVVLSLAAAYDRRAAGLAFILTSMVHPFGDAYRTILTEGTTAFLLWPLDPVQIWAGGMTLPIKSPQIDLLFAAIALFVWLLQGYPGVTLSESPTRSSE